MKYPFPTNVGSNYVKDYKKHREHKYSKTEKEGGFNLEKEHKIINPHGMDMHTVQKDKFRGFKVQPKEKVKVERKEDKAPFAKGSIYKVSFFSNNLPSTNTQTGKTPTYW